MKKRLCLMRYIAQPNIYVSSESNILLTGRFNSLFIHFYWATFHALIVFSITVVPGVKKNTLIVAMLANLLRNPVRSPEQGCSIVVDFYHHQIYFFGIAQHNNDFIQLCKLLISLYIAKEESINKCIASLQHERNENLHLLDHWLKYKNSLYSSAISS